MSILDFNVVFILFFVCNFYFKMSFIYFLKDGEVLLNLMKCYKKICFISIFGFII